MGSVELRQLEYFVAVAEHLHFGRAAEALSIGQPAVSQQVARLERTIGTPLLERTPRSVRLTDAGRRFLPLAREALAAVDRACEAVADSSGRSRHPVRLGPCSGLGNRLDGFLSALEQLRPGTSVELMNAPTRPRLERVAAGQLDAAFVRGQYAVEGVELIEVWQDRLLVALPAHHPLARKPEVPIGELARLPLRSVARRTNPALIDLVLGACGDAGHAPQLVEHDGPVETLLAAVAAGAPSWTVLYETHAQMLNPARVAFVETSPALMLTTYLALPAATSSRDAAPLMQAAAIAADLEPAPAALPTNPSAEWRGDDEGDPNNTPPGEGGGKESRAATSFASRGWKKTGESFLLGGPRGGGGPPLPPPPPT